jgi:hypothetical protein
MLVFGILSVFVTVFIVDVAAGIADLSPDDGFVVLGGTIIAAAATVAGGGYRDRSNAEDGLHSVKRNAPNADVEAVDA